MGVGLLVRPTRQHLRTQNSESKTATQVVTFKPVADTDFILEGVTIRERVVLIFTFFVK